MLARLIGLSLALLLAWSKPVQANLDAVTNQEAAWVSGPRSKRARALRSTCSASRTASSTTRRSRFRCLAR